MFSSRNDPIRPMTKAMIAVVQNFLSKSNLEDVMLSNTPPSLWIIAAGPKICSGDLIGANLLNARGDLFHGFELTACQAK